MDLNKNIKDFDLVFLDLETTGLDPVIGDAICEIGAFKVKNNDISDKFHSLVNPRKSMPEAAYRVHKISDQDLAEAPYFEDVADKFISFVGGSVVCAYNVGFDMGFIDNHLRKINYSPLNVPAIDILAMAREALNLSKYNLAIVAQFFNIDCSNGLHRALDDALAAYKIFFKLLDIFKEKGIEELADFLSLYGFNNEISRNEENQKILFFKEAIDNKLSFKIRYLSFANIIEEETILPLRIVQENSYCCLLYQGSQEVSSQIKLNRILKITTV